MTLAVALITAGPGLARTFDVDSTADLADIVPGDGICDADAGEGVQCTLRAAVEEANNWSEDDVVNVPAETYLLDSGDDIDIENIEGSGTLTIVGAGAATTTVDGNDQHRIFEVHSDTTASISGLTMQNGDAWGTGDGSDGGGILNHGVLTLANNVVRSNEGNWGGGIDNDYDALLTITGTTISENFASDGGGLYNASHGPEPEAGADPPGMTITDSTIELNIANYDTGGGIYNDGEASIAGSRILTNRTSGPLGGGGIFNGGRQSLPPELVLTNSVVSENVVFNGFGGGISNEPGAMLTVTDTTISRNFADDGGAGIFNAGNATVARSAISANGVYGEDENRRTGAGGGVLNSSFVLVTQTGLLAPVLVIENSTISGNTAAFGGGLYQMSGFDFQGEAPTPTTTLNHATITQNVAFDGEGGGIFLERPFTIEENGFIPVMAAVRLGNTILSANTAEDLPNPTGPTAYAVAISNCAGQPPVSDGHNLENADTCALAAAGDLKNTDPKLGPLAANGGSTHTHELLSDSPAIDKAAGGQSCPATDQRGTTRPQGAGCDIGAYERLFQAPQPPAPAPPPPAVTPPPAPPAIAPAPRRPRAVRRCTVPNVRGKTVRQARRAITRAGCRAVVMGRRYSAAYAPGRVIGQSVRPGARVRRGTVVRLVLSRGEQRTRARLIPPFTG